ncbi:MAG: NUDIX hydrolase [Candidatus Aenigmarchaeota archaeon]|nr:NUDIX hydrolase [Candidatus Aenigmarchaeota archaeon]
MKERPVVESSEKVYHGFLDLRVDKIRLRSGIGFNYDVVTVGDGVAVLPFIDEYTLLLAKQYRHPVGEYLLELIQGGISRGESVEEAAMRELLEETGYTGRLERINTMYPLPSSLDMRLHILRATGLEKKHEPKLDPWEDLTIVEIPYNRVLEEVCSGNHRDSALGWAILHHEIKSKS